MQLKRTFGFSLEVRDHDQSSTVLKYQDTTWTVRSSTGDDARAFTVERAVPEVFRRRSSPVSATSNVGMGMGLVSIPISVDRSTSINVNDDGSYARLAVVRRRLPGPYVTVS